MNYPVLVWWLALAVFGPSVVSSTARSPETNVKDYGITWTFLPDENGKPHVVYLGEDTRNEPLVIQVALYNRDDHFRGIVENSVIIVFDNEYFHPAAATTKLMKNFNARMDTKIVAHGWLSSTNKSAKKLIEEYKNYRKLNRFEIRWDITEDEFWYATSVLHVEEVGQAVAELIDFLVRQKKADTKRIHLIGHSLGAHVMGYAGNHFNVIANKTIGRITGLDPAGPGFEYRNFPKFDYPLSNKHLDSTDADFVDVIHTDVGGWNKSRSLFTDLGFHAPIGHVDFYVNGNSEQEGCDFYTPTCSHFRALEYYTESINSKIGFYSVPCPDVEAALVGNCSGDEILMGDPVPTKARGIYYLTTNPDTPFAMGKQAAGP